MKEPEDCNDENIIPSMFKSFTSLIEQAIGGTNWHSDPNTVNLPFKLLKWMDLTLSSFAQATNGFDCAFNERQANWLAGFKKLLFVVLNSLQASLNSESQGRTAHEALDSLLSILEKSK
jgi:hypothetical protein